MSDPEPPKETRPHRAARKSHNDIRAAALEKALRENLRRRKAANAEAPASAASPETLHEKAKENPGEGA